MLDPSHCVHSRAATAIWSRLQGAKAGIYGQIPTAAQRPTNLDLDSLVKWLGDLMTIGRLPATMAMQASIFATASRP